METVQKTTTSKDTPTEEVSTDMPTRDEETQAKLDKAEALLDEIDDVLDTETVEHVMTLADLIRGGAKRKPQVYGAMYGTLHQNGEECQGTCALGAADDEARNLGLL